MSLISSAESITHALSQLLGGEQTLGFSRPALSVQALRLNRVEPGAFAWKPAYQDAYSLTALLGLPVVLFDPLTYLLANVPPSIVPHHHQHSLACGPKPLTTPVQELSSDGADRTAVYEAQPHLFQTFFRQPQTKTGQRLWVGVIASNFLLDQLQASTFFG